MNIFVLDLDPQKAAEYHCDKHVVKMILETAQLLCNAHSDLDPPYKKTHYNHPCSKWVRESISNYDWLCDLGMNLCKEYTNRYNKTHKTESVLNWLIENKPNLPDIGITPFAQAMPDQYRNSSNPVKAYRDYYINEKLKIATWKIKRPDFIPQI